MYVTTLRVVYEYSYCVRVVLRVVYSYVATAINVGLDWYNIIMISSFVLFTSITYSYITLVV